VAPHRQHTARPMLLNVAALLVLVVLFWMAHAAHGHLRAAVRQARAQASVPFVLNGLGLDFGALVQPEITPPLHGGQHLLLVVSDRCDFCRQELLTWMGLVEDASFGPNDSIIVISSRTCAARRSANKTRSARSTRIRVSSTAVISPGGADPSSHAGSGGG